MNERTNITDQGYSYGGKEYVYETRKDFNNNPYQVAIEKKVAPTTIQSTSAQRAVDQQTQVKYDALAASKGIGVTASPNGTVDASKTTTVDPSAASKDQQQPKNAQDAITSYYTQGYTDPYEIYTKILNSNDPTVNMESVTKKIDELKNDASLSVKSNYAKQLRTLDEDRARVQTQFEEMKRNLNEENKRAIDSISSKFAFRRATLQQNMENLMGVHEKQGYASGGNRYTSMQTAGLLTNDENNLVSRLAELDSQEQIALLEASQAKSKGDWDNLNSTLANFDKINDDRVNILKNLSTIADEENKRIDAEKKVNEKAKLAGYANPTAYANGVALTYAKESLALDDAQLEGFIKNKAVETGLDATILKSSILKEREALNKKTKTPAAKKPTVTKQKLDDISSIIKDFQLQMKAKNWKGANPDAYKYYREQLLSAYGTAAVNELDKQMKSLGIIVDKTK